MQTTLRDLIDRLEEVADQYSDQIPVAVMYQEGYPLKTNLRATWVGAGDGNPLADECEECGYLLVRPGEPGDPCFSQHNPDADSGDRKDITLYLVAGGEENYGSHKAWEDGEDL